MIIMSLQILWAHGQPTNVQTLLVDYGNMEKIFI